jgi:glycolate oxidase FAD binding subunit
VIEYFLVLTPHTPEALAEALHAAASQKQTISLCGKATKRKMGGPVEPADVSISTRNLTRVLQYEPQDLTISVEAGIPYCSLARMLAENRQMVPLDPPFADNATVGGILAANSSGPRRRLYGTARDLVIGMKFATLEGKLVQSGGMVVKNVAGLDMGKLMIGSFGTLAAIAVVNFKLLPLPVMERTFLLPFNDLAGAISARDQILRGVLQPSAIDLLNPSAAEAYGSGRYVLAVQASGNAAAIGRYAAEVSTLAEVATLKDDEQDTLWTHIREFTPRFLAQTRDGVVVRVSCTLKELPRVIDSIEAPVVARAGTGVAYAYFSRAEFATAWMSTAAGNGWQPLIEFAPEAQKSKLDMWPRPDGNLELMKRVKQMFDPHYLLNRGRLYRHI